MEKYTQIITIKETNIFIDLILGFVILIAVFISLNYQVKAMVKTWLDFSPRADFVYEIRTKENQTVIEIKNKTYVDKVFFNGVECRDKLNVNLNEDENIFIFTLVGGGKEKEQTVKITKDTLTPMFETKFPFTDIIINSNTLSFEGKLSETANVALNDTPCSTNELAVNCSLEVKENTKVSFIAKDLAGNELKHEFNISIDTQAPTLQIKADNPTFQEKIAIVTKGDEKLLVVTVKGVEGKRVDDNTFSNEVTLNLGKNEFEIIGIDLAGNQTKQNLSIERKEAPKTNTSNNNQSSNNNNTVVNKPSGCSTVYLNVSNVQTQVFAGENQSATVKLTCGNGSGFSGQSVNITVKYSNGTSKSYSKTTDGSGVANFSFAVENISGGATLTAKYSVMQTNVNFTVN